MQVSLTSQDEMLVRKRLESGDFQSAEEVLHSALETLEARDLYLARNREAMAAKIDRGPAQIARGEGIPGNDVAKRLREMRRSRSAVVIPSR